MSNIEKLELRRTLSSSKEEIKICAKINGDGFGVAAGYMVFDSSMPEFQEVKDVILNASRKYLARVGGDMDEHEQTVYYALKEKFSRK